MLEQFLNHIDRNNLCSHADKILLAVSGGVDSMVMLHLFKQAGYSFGVAHCNFGLRADESQGDEDLVRNACKEQEIPFHIHAFETKKYAAQHGLSIQMAARDLRYTYFNRLAEEHKYTYVATAHHLNDSLETVLLNLIRGTGIDGITGISVNHQNIIRPLLFASRDVIVDYANACQLRWREDSSNASDKYHRNLIRNQVVPLLKMINTNLEESFQHSLERIQGAALLAMNSIDLFTKQAIRESATNVYINKALLASRPSQAVLLWEIIKDKGFNYIQCKEITLTNHQSGKVFYSATHQLTIDRDQLIISSSKKKAHEVNVLIEAGQVNASRGKQNFILNTHSKSDFKLQRDPLIAQLGLKQLKFPLTWRSWKPGDKFVPIGMKQTKKLSDFFVDNKVPVPEKETITVLESAGEIVWIVGYRISDLFKVTDETAEVLVIRFIGLQSTLDGPQS